MMKKIIPLVILLSSSLLFASEVSTTVKVSTDKFCKKTQLSYEPKKDVDFCMETQTEYPKVSSSNKVLETHIHSAITKQLKNQQNPKKYILEAIKEADIGAIVEHESSLVIKVLSTTPKTFVLDVTLYEYLGGAHGLASRSLINYDSKTGKKISLNDIFIASYKNKLKDIVEKEYRHQNKLKATDKLSEKADWFEDEFVLAENIGLGDDGLHLEYNSYEIKSYASGPTSLIVAYSLLKNIIKPNSYLSPLIQK
jgi:hypothetical protein